MAIRVVAYLPADRPGRQAAAPVRALSVRAIVAANGGGSLACGRHDGLVHIFANGTSISDSARSSSGGWGDRPLVISVIAGPFSSAFLPI